MSVTGAARFAPGDSVRVADRNVEGHVRTPRYVRGKRGIVERICGAFRNPEQLARGVTRHLLTYSTGAPATPFDQRAIDGIVKGAAADDYGLRSLIHGVIQSDLFRSK